MKKQLIYLSFALGFVVSVVVYALSCPPPDAYATARCDMACEKLFDSKNRIIITAGVAPNGNGCHLDAHDKCAGVVKCTCTIPQINGPDVNKDASWACDSKVSR